MGQAPTPRSLSAGKRLMGSDDGEVMRSNAKDYRMLCSCPMGTMKEYFESMYGVVVYSVLGLGLAMPVVNGAHLPDESAGPRSKVIVLFLGCEEYKSWYCVLKRD